MTDKDRTEFMLYLGQCTDQQVLGVLDKERAARRYDYEQLAWVEAQLRGLGDE